MDLKLIGKHLIIIAIIFAFYCTPEANSLVIHEPRDHDYFEVYAIWREITLTDANEVKTIVQERPVGTKFIFRLDSSGGDIYAAMEIGKLIRKARATVTIPKGSKCYSSCVFVLAGGVGRVVFGEVGIHRPFSTYVGERDYESIQSEYRKMRATAKNYLLEMNLPDQLFDAMVRVPPEEVRILSYDELESLGLAGNDPVEQEDIDSRGALIYGISKTEYYQRKARADKNCPIPPKESELVWVECRQAIMYGVPLNIYKTRNARAFDECSAYKGNLEKVSSCVRRVLQGDR